MTRDPSDGSVRENPSDLLTGGPLREKRVLETDTSGLQTGSTKPENLARLERSRGWLRDYHAGKFNPKPQGE